jgi:uncharacterized membrane protein (Fun14 family)
VFWRCSAGLIARTLSFNYDCPGTVRISSDCLRAVRSGLKDSIFEIVPDINSGRMVGYEIANKIYRIWNVGRLAFCVMCLSMMMVVTVSVIIVNVLYLNVPEDSGSRMLNNQRCLEYMVSLEYQGH